MQRSPDIPGLSDLVQIGQGGNGIVYRAGQAQLRRVVAVKILATRLDELSAQRFALEGQALGSVSGHPNIVPIYAADTTADGRPYLVMMLCENGSLDDRLRRDGAQPVPAVLDLGVRMCGALQTAHDAGLLHRDIKPGNILFDSYDVPRLADFGQARMADTNLTRTGDVVATPGYAAPEVLTGERATVRSDVYSLAATLAAALLGHGPFHRDDDESIAAILLRVIQDPPPDLRQHGVPDALATQLEKALDKTPGRRQMSAGELGRRLQDVQRALALAVTPMIVAGDAAAHSPLAPPGGLPLPERTRPVDGPVPAATALLPGGGAQLGDPAPAGPPRRAAGKPGHVGRWVAVAAAAALVLGFGTWGLTAALSSVEPTNPDNANDLLIGSSDYGPGTWQATADMNLLSSVIGTVPQSPEDADSVYPSSLLECLGLDPANDIVSSKASAQYVDTDATSLDGDELGDKYRVARSLAMVTSSAATAEDWVQAWDSPQFDTCLDEVSDLGMNAGNESTLYGQPAQISVPEHEADVPDGVLFGVRQVAVPLKQTSGDEEPATGSSGETARAGWRYVTVLAMSAGTALEYVVMQSSAESVTPEMIDAVAEAFVDLATA